MNYLPPLFWLGVAAWLIVDLFHKDQQIAADRARAERDEGILPKH